MLQILYLVAVHTSSIVGAISYTCCRKYKCSFMCKGDWWICYQDLIQEQWTNATIYSFYIPYTIQQPMHFMSLLHYIFSNFGMYCVCYNNISIQNLDSCFYSIFDNCFNNFVLAIQAMFTQAQIMDIQGNLNQSRKIIMEVRGSLIKALML